MFRISPLWFLKDLTFVSRNSSGLHGEKPILSKFNIPLSEAEKFASNWDVNSSVSSPPIICLRVSISLNEKSFELV